MISVLIGVLIICVVGAICFWAIEKFVKDRRLANLLKLLVVLICLAAILSACCLWRELTSLATADAGPRDLDQRHDPQRFYFCN